MNAQKPFIKKIKSGRHTYIYDVNTNQIIEINPLLYPIIDEIPGILSPFPKEKFKDLLKAPGIRQEIEDIREMMKSHPLFSAHRPIISSDISSVEQVRKSLQTGLEQLILEVSDRCNMDCKYCVFSGKYKYARKHGSNDMTIEIAKKAVDFFTDKIENSKPRIRNAIIFYGGEPLINFKLIKEIVDYSFEKKQGKLTDFLFSISTNGTLLDNIEIIDYLASKKIHLTVSLDGPASIHDRNRVFKNGKSSFDRVFKNLTQIRNRNPDYFLTHVSINIVMAPPLDVEEVSSFFFENDFFKELREKISVGFVNTADMISPDECRPKNVKREIKTSHDKMLTRYKKALAYGTYNNLTFEKLLFTERFHRIASRNSKPLAEYFPPLGACFPGKRKLFVDTKGNFFMCEKVDANFSIGNIYSGFDYEKIYNYFIEFDRMFNECSGCWALRLCHKCFNNIRCGDKLDIERKSAFCTKNKTNIEKDLIMFCEIIRKNPEAFQVFKDVLVR